MSDGAFPSVRRVVMGEPTDGSSVFTHVENIEPISPWPGFAQYYVWGWDGDPELPLNPTEPYQPTSHFPAPGSVRVTANVLGSLTRSEAPGHEPDREHFSSLIAAQSPNRAVGSHPGMHRTDTIDVGVVVSGKVRVEAEDGTSVVLGPGDVYIQNGAMHAWHEDPDDPALVVFVLVGTARGQSSQRRGTT
jgi:hypothetical protein